MGAYGMDAAVSTLTTSCAPSGYPSPCSGSSFYIGWGAAGTSYTPRAVAYGQLRSNAPRITPAGLSFIEKPSSDPHPILTPRRPPSRYLPIPLLYHIYTIPNSLSRAVLLHAHICRSPPSYRALDHLLPPTPHLATPCLPSLQPPLSAPSRAQYSALYVCWAR